MKHLLIAALAAAAAWAQLSPDQTAALANLNSGLAAKTQAVTDARAALTTASFAPSGSTGDLRAMVDRLASAELALAAGRAEGFAAIQQSPAKFTPAQVATLAASGGGRGAGGGPSRAQSGSAPSYAVGGTVPRLQEAQLQALMGLTYATMPLARAATAARAALTAAAFTDSAASGTLKSRADALRTAELALATARLSGLARIQASPDKLAPDQLAAFVSMGGSFDRMSFTQPRPIDFSAHEGYISLFDGVSLKDWDGNPKFWRVENGAIVGESTAKNPSGNTYLVYRGLEARDFTLKLEIKVEGTGGTGIQYRSKTGLPWLAPIADNVTANNGPVNLNWMMTGPQADFWPVSRDWTGQFYSENTPMRILSWRGQVVEGAGMREKQLMGNIGDREALGKLVKMDDWNEYTIIARGGTFIQILNGQLMAVMVDDDPQSSNNQSGLIGIELEQVCKVSVRNIWMKKLN